MRKGALLKMKNSQFPHLAAPVKQKKAINQHRWLSLRLRCASDGLFVAITAEKSALFLEVGKLHGLNFSALLARCHFGFS